MSNIEDARLSLHKHQQEAYENVEKLFQDGRYAAVVFPTGCGKSFVTLEYILNHPDERILFLSPRNAIKEQMYEYIVKYIGGLDLSVEEIQEQYGSMKNAAKSFIPNIECMLYQTILKTGENESLDKVLDRLSPDLIVVDEMHHLKTKRNDVVLDEEENENGENEWGRKFGELLNRFPNAKVLGLSATPIRNDNVNVVERLFKNSVASEISLLEAMEEGIIIPPKYITPDFIKPDELDTLLEQIEKAEEPRKTELKQKYDELVKISTNAKGIPELLGEHITKTNGKYIIFCKSIEDMEQKVKEATEWFREVDDSPEVYMISSKHKDSQEQLNDFNNSDSEHLKLLYCVGMIDEGVHLNGVSGVILTARTESRPVYLQRLGRAISTGDDKEQALVIDLVNNNEILFNEQTGEEQQYEVRDIELLRAVIEWIEEKNNGELPRDEEGKSLKERTLARRLERIKNKYIKYFDNPKLLEEITSREQREDIEEIIDEAIDVELWTTDLVISNYDKEIDDNINSFLSGIEIKGYRRDFRELLREARGTDIPAMLQNARDIQSWMEERGTTVPPNSEDENEEEKSLGFALTRIRCTLIIPYNEAKTKEEKAKVLKRRSLTQEQYDEIVQIIDEIDRNNIPVLLRNARNIRNWMEEQGTTKPPSQTGKNIEEKRLGRALSAIRETLIKPYKEAKTEEEKTKILKNRRLTQEQYDEIVRIIDEIDINNIPVLLRNARDIQKWIEEQGKTRLPRGNGKDLGEEEKRLGKALNTIRQSLIKPYKEAKTEEEKTKILKNKRLTQEQYDEIERIIDEIDINNIPVLLQNVRDIRSWMEERGTTIPPNQRSKDEEEKRLGRALSTIRQRLIKSYKEAKTEAEKAEILKSKGLTQGQYDEILQIIDEIDRNNIPVLLRNARNIRNWMEEQGTTKPPSQTGKNIEEKRLGRALSAIRKKLIKLYKEAKTEEEMAKILERSSLTQEQFEEIVSIVDGIDRNNPKGKKLQKAKDTRDEAERVRSKAKELEVQVKVALDKKRGKTNDK